jgi:hypothetical protein
MGLWKTFMGWFTKPVESEKVVPHKSLWDEKSELDRELQLRSRELDASKRLVLNYKASRGIRDELTVVDHRIAVGDRNADCMLFALYQSCAEAQKLFADVQQRRAACMKKLGLIR